MNTLKSYFRALQGLETKPALQAVCSSERSHSTNRACLHSKRHGDQGVVTSGASWRPSGCSMLTKNFCHCKIAKAQPGVMMGKGILMCRYGSMSACRPLLGLLKLFQLLTLLRRVGHLQLHRLQVLPTSTVPPSYYECIGLIESQTKPCMETNCLSWSSPLKPRRSGSRCHDLAPDHC